MSEIIIRVENLCKVYENDGVFTNAVCGVNFEIKKGEFVAIMGPSGSGKSTLMQILGFLDKQSDGDYFFDNENVNNFDEDKLAAIRNEKIGFIFQSFNLLPRTSVFENVELPMLYLQKKISGAEKKRRVDEALKAVLMDHRAEYLSNQLSGGERQRVAIARALVNNPDLIFADEPTGNLDSKSGLQVMKILQHLNNDGHTIILVTHETFTAEHAKRIIKIKDGNIDSDNIVTNRRIAQDGELLK